MKDKENEDLGNSGVVSEDFHPKITDKSKKLSRNGQIDDLLYQDALRRQEKARGIECHNSRVASVPGKSLNLNN